MKKSLNVLILLCLGLTSCKKDVKEEVPTTEPTCENITMDGDRAHLVGSWEWYTSKVKITYPNGHTVYTYLTPVNQGYTYQFNLNSDGTIKGYKDGILTDDLSLTNLTFEQYNVNYSSVRIESEINCGTNTIYVGTLTPNSYSFDTLQVDRLPIRIDDAELGMTVLTNYFKRI